MFYKIIFIEIGIVILLKIIFKYYKIIGLLIKFILKAKKEILAGILVYGTMTYLIYKLFFNY